MTEWEARARDVVDAVRMRVQCGNSLRHVDDIWIEEIAEAMEKAVYEASIEEESDA